LDVVVDVLLSVAVPAEESEVAKPWIVTPVLSVSERHFETLVNASYDN
jgi:hypothetical protein